MTVFLLDVSPVLAEISAAVVVAGIAPAPPAPCLSNVIFSYLDKTTSSSPELPNDALATTATLPIYRRCWYWYWCWCWCCCTCPTCRCCPTRDSSTTHPCPVPRTPRSLQLSMSSNSFNCSQSCLPSCCCCCSSFFRFICITNQRQSECGKGWQQVGGGG